MSTSNFPVKGFIYYLLWFVACFLLLDLTMTLSLLLEILSLIWNGQPRRNLEKVKLFLQNFPMSWWWWHFLRAWIISTWTPITSGLPSTRPFKLPVCSGIQGDFPLWPPIFPYRLQSSWKDPVGPCWICAFTTLITGCSVSEPGLNWFIPVVFVLILTFP